MARSDARLTERGVQPARDMVHGLVLLRAELVASAVDHHEIDARVRSRDALEHRERPELVVAALHDERAAGHRGERLLVLRTRTIRRRDRMADDRERIGRLKRRQERAHATAEAAADE